MLQFKNILRIFVYVIAGNTVGAGIFITFVSKDKQIPAATLWQLIILAAVCSVGTLIFYSSKELSKPQIIVRHIVHYVYINISILGAVSIWDWLDFGFNFESIVLLVIIAFVYIGIISLTFIQDTKTAEDVNEKLKNISKENIED